MTPEKEPSQPVDILPHDRVAAYIDQVAAHKPLTRALMRVSAACLEVSLVGYRAVEQEGMLPDLWTRVYDRTSVEAARERYRRGPQTRMHQQTLPLLALQLQPEAMNALLATLHTARQVVSPRQFPRYRQEVESRLLADPNDSFLTTTRKTLYQFKTQHLPVASANLQWQIQGVIRDLNPASPQPIALLGYRILGEHIQQQWYPALSLPERTSEDIALQIHSAYQLPSSR